MRKRAAMYFLPALLAFSLLTGCSSRNAVTGENLQDDLPELLEQEVFFENVYRGGGLPTVPNAPYVPDENYQCYVPVTDENYPTVAALKEATEKVFTKEYAEENFYVWGFEADSARYRDVDGQLCMDIGQGGGLDKQWDSDSCEVVSEDEDTIVVTVDYLNYDSIRTAEITLAKTEDGLRIAGMAG